MEYPVKSDIFKLHSYTYGLVLVVNIHINTIKEGNKKKSRPFGTAFFYEIDISYNILF